jgi:hypothetical protein
MKTKTELEKTRDITVFEYTLTYESLLSLILQKKYDLEDDDESLDDIIDEICQVHDYPSFIKRYCRNQEVHPVSVIKLHWCIDDFDDFVRECFFNEYRFEEDFIDFLPKR